MARRKQKTTSPPPAPLSTADFSIVQIPCDQGPPVSTQRILQIITRDGESKKYVTESSYMRGELEALFARLITLSYERYIMKRQPALGPVAGNLYWVHLSEDTLRDKKQPRVDPEAFE
jgi:hypothetical protein